MGPVQGSPLHGKERWATNGTDLPPLAGGRTVQNGEGGHSEVGDENRNQNGERGDGEEGEAPPVSRVCRFLFVLEASRSTKLTRHLSFVSFSGSWNFRLRESIPFSSRSYQFFLSLRPSLTPPFLPPPSSPLSLFPSASKRKPPQSNESNSSRPPPLNLSNSNGQLSAPRSNSNGGGNSSPAPFQNVHYVSQSHQNGSPYLQNNGARGPTISQQPGQTRKVDPL